jgi:hypothetical protein
MIERSARSAETEPSSDVAQPQHKRPLPSWRALALAGGGIVVGAVLVWLGITQPWHQDPSPFTPAVASSVQFPLYYPTTLPKGYHIDKKSVTTPDTGVVVFEIHGPKGQKLFVSEEARSETFNLGGFYKSLKDMKQVGVSDGAIAVGHNGNNLVGSRANNKTWILTNTRASVSPDDIIAMLRSLVHGQ